VIKERSDLHFLFLTKRIDRFDKCKPDDWFEGYDNVTIGVSVSNQKTPFTFRQCATYFIKDGKEYKLKYNELSKQAKKANIDYIPNEGETL